MQLFPQISSRSPIKYVGGKYYARKKIEKYIPYGTNEICSPFFGSGAFELYLTRRGIRVYGYDKFDVLVDFWGDVINNNQELAHEIEKIGEITKDKYLCFFDLLTKNYEKNILHSAMYFCVLRSSYGAKGLSSCWFLGNSDINTAIINSTKIIRQFKNPNFSVEYACFTESIPRHADKLVYADPPYWIKGGNYYGRGGDLHLQFDHHKFAEVIKKHPKWIISYNKCAEVMEMYKEFEIVDINWTYTLGAVNEKEGKEILILNL